jgi:hypothetical protein
MTSVAADAASGMTSMGRLRIFRNDVNQQPSPRKARSDQTTVTPEFAAGKYPGSYLAWGKIPDIRFAYSGMTSMERLREFRDDETKARPLPG